jgi:hypothetical protein
MHDRWRRRILALQALYYLATGLWPLVHLPSFEAVTGPKTDDWLVHMVGAEVDEILCSGGSASEVRLRLHTAD